jgi:hypothetical protein
MAEQDYEAIAGRSEAILLDLLLHAHLGTGAEEMRAAVQALQPALNANLHALLPSFVTGGVRIAAAGPVPSQRILLRILLEVIDHSVKMGMWTVDYDTSGRLRRVGDGYLTGVLGDDGVIRFVSDNVAR